MRDYIFEDATGKEMPVAEMPVADIQDCLQSMVLVDGTDAEAVKERLRIELLIRELGLR